MTSIVVRPWGEPLKEITSNKSGTPKTFYLQRIALYDPATPFQALSFMMFLNDASQALDSREYLVTPSNFKSNDGKLELDPSSNWIPLDKAGSLKSAS